MNEQPLLSPGALARWQVLRRHVQGIDVPEIAHAEREVLLALKLFGALSVPALAQVLRISAAPLRHHLRRLEGSGYVGREPGRRPASGRPPSLFRITAQGEALFPDAVAGLGFHALEYLAETDPGALEVLLCRAAGDDAHRAAVAGPPQRVPTESPASTAAARLERAAIYLGYLPEAVPTAEGTVLTLHHCPYRRLVAVFPGFCRIQAEALATIVPGCRLQRVSHRAAGDPVCAYRVTPLVG